MRRVYRSLSVPKTRRRAICQRGVWPFRVVRTAAVRTSASPSVAHASHEGLNDRNGSNAPVCRFPSRRTAGWYDMSPGTVQLTETRHASRRRFVLTIWGGGYLCG